MEPKRLNLYRHFYLYAKGHYQGNDILEDLKQINELYTGVDKKYLTTVDALAVLSQATAFHVNFERFLHILTEKMHWIHIIDSKEDVLMLLIQSCLSVLRATKVSGIAGELGHADEAVLPLSKL